MDLRGLAKVLHAERGLRNHGAAHTNALPPGHASHEVQPVATHFNANDKIPVAEHELGADHADPSVRGGGLLHARDDGRTGSVSEAGLGFYYPARDVLHGVYGAIQEVCGVYAEDVVRVRGSGTRTGARTCRVRVEMVGGWYSKD